MVSSYKDKFVFFFVIYSYFIMTTTTSTTSVKSQSSSTDIHHDHYRATPLSIEHFIDERYPKTSFEQIPSISVAYPSPKLNNQPLRSRHSLRFRTQPVTLTEIHETDEENQIANDNQQQQQSKIKLVNDYERLEHLTLAENLRRTTRTKIPLKNFLERQRLKTTREELSETDGN